MIKNRYKVIEINKIPEGNFEGYYWLSDQSKPEIILEEEIDKEKFQRLPFVVEAYFYSRETFQSIQIKNVDGRYICALIDLSDCEQKAQQYVGHGIGSIDFLLVEAWEDKKDDLIDEMITKVPSWVAFKGFVEPKKTNENE